MTVFSKLLHKRKKKMTEEENFLVPNDTYMKAGVHIGNKYRTKAMSQFIYKTRPDGLSVLNVQQIDKRIRLLAKFMAQYDQKDIIIVARRENAWKPAKMFCNATGTQIFMGRYQPGRLTNTKLDTFVEGKFMLITDPWPDRNAIKDGKFAGMVVVGLCDSNNDAIDLDLVLPCNNKGNKSLGLIFYLLAREYCAEKKIEFGGKEEDFSSEV